jgi:exportin-7
MDGPFRDYPSLTVYHPNSDNGHAFINVGMVGFIGGLTGLSSTQMAISEIGVAYPDETFGSESRVGIPFIFLLRDILQYDLTIDDAISRIANEKRTCGRKSSGMM